jgi:diacylglycerol kinase family enzyme
VIVANGRYYGYRPIDESATQSGGKLTVFARDERNRLQTLVTYAALALGKQRDLEAGAVWSTAEPLEVRAKPRQRVAVDGRLVGKTPICVSVVRAALRVMTASRDERGT